MGEIDVNVSLDTLAPTRVPAYRGAQFVPAAYPSAAESWTDDPDRRRYDGLRRRELNAYVGERRWFGPKREVFFFCDLHADADAFLASLVASGGVEVTGPGDADLALTPRGRRGRFVVGGDCFDKGPSNLRLLRTLGHLRATGARLEVLGGNHDIRAVMGLQALGRKDPCYAHLFARLGKKVVPLFREVADAYLQGRPAGSFLPEDEARELLFPAEAWYGAFPAAAEGTVPGHKIAKELVRIREKTGEMQQAAAELGLSLGMVAAAAEIARDLFLAPAGEFAWFFRDMKLARRAGSYLLLHAGVDDTVAELLARGGVDALNDEFERLFSESPFELYYGTVGNAFRTKYRGGDWALTQRGIRHLGEAGVHAMVHGHRNVTGGQRMMLRHGLLHVECDTCVDANTRAQKALPGQGFGCVIIGTDVSLTALSADSARARVFAPPTPRVALGSRLAPKAARA
jgi:hypothetical protein